LYSLALMVMPSSPESEQDVRVGNNDNRSGDWFIKYRAEIIIAQISFMVVNSIPPAAITGVWASVLNKEFGGDIRVKFKTPISIH